MAPPLERQKTQEALLLTENRKRGNERTKSRLIGALSKKIVQLQIKLREVSLARLKLVSSWLRSKVQKRRRYKSLNIQPAMRRAGNLRNRLKRVTVKVFRHPKNGEVVQFSAEDRATKK